MFKKVLFNATAQTVGKAITAATTLLVTVIIGKALGPAGYGDFTKVFTFTGYFYTFADFGLNAAYIKISTGKENGLINSLLYLRFIISIVFVTAAVVISQLLPYNEAAGTGFSPLVKSAILIASLTIITQSAFTTFNAFFQKKLRYDLSTVCAVFGTVVVLTAAIAASVIGPSVHFFAIAYVFGGISFSFAAYILILVKFKQKILPKLNYVDFKHLLKTSWPIGTALVFNLIYFRSDIFILSLAKKSAEVGVYGLAYQFFEAALAIPIFFANALFPLLNSLRYSNLSGYKAQVRKWAYLMGAISLVMTAGLIMASFFIPLIFESFTGSQNALTVLSLGMPFFFISALLWHVVIVEERQKILIPIYLIGGIVNVILNLIFIPKYGYMAAAVTTVVSEALIAILLVLVVATVFKKSQPL